MIKSILNLESDFCATSLWLRLIIWEFSWRDTFYVLKIQTFQDFLPWIMCCLTSYSLGFNLKRSLLFLQYFISINYNNSLDFKIPMVSKHGLYLIVCMCSIDSLEMMFSCLYEYLVYKLKAILFYFLYDDIIIVYNLSYKALIYF
jgi:hypothetical protein